MDSTVTVIFTSGVAKTFQHATLKVGNGVLEVTTRETRVGFEVTGKTLVLGWPVTSIKEFTIEPE